MSPRLTTLTRPKKRAPRRFEVRTSLPGLSLVTEITGRQFYSLRYFDAAGVRRRAHLGWKTNTYGTRDAIRDALVLKQCALGDECAEGVAKLVGQFGLDRVRAAILAYVAH